MADTSKSSFKKIGIPIILPPAQPSKRRRVHAGEHTVLPGTFIHPEPGYMRGHGTLENAEKTDLCATVFGTVCRINKLVSVKAANTRYVAEIGDVVVGRVVEVGLKRWKVDVNAHQDGALMLSAITLPGGVQRRRTTADQLQMRNFFVEHDLISAEVQQIYSDGVIAIHTRNLRYGKLRYGVFLSVPCALIKRCSSHFHRLSCGVYVILGNNGYVWVSPFPSGTDPTNALLSEKALETKLPDPSQVTKSMRERVCRVRNCILALSKEWISIHPGSIILTYEASTEYAAHELLRPDIAVEITKPAHEEEEKNILVASEMEL